ncbi:MAG: response regulator [Sulfurimonas sp.]|nr:response regulator [Sulfurimonas sp.]
MSDLKNLKLLAKGFSVLYVEDNKALRLNAGKLLKKFFDKVETASDGKEGLEKFKKYHYPIVITDIKMPNMDGIEFASHVRKIQPDTKIVIMSAFDDKDYLFKAIELGIFRYLKKPVNITNLANILYDALVEIKHERETKLFYTHLNNVFNYQSSMVLMMDDFKPILANDVFLDFFGVDDVEDFVNRFKNIGDSFLEHDGFLYNHGTIDCFDILELNEKKLFHVKMKNAQGEIRHLILKYQLIPERIGHSILSFDDITELNLLKLFDEKQTQNDDKKHDSKAMFDLLAVIKRNSAKIEVHNYYKGLSITNDALITEVGEDFITIKTSYLQEKAIQFERQTVLISDAFPSAIFCDEVVKVGFENQTVVLKGLKFSNSSPTQRATIRVVPEEKHTVSLFLGQNKFHGDVSIEDISLNAIKLKLNAFPAGLEKGDEVNIDIVLELDKRPLIINTKATMFRKSKSKYSFSVVFIFKESKKRELVKYITKRQMAIIREFKGLQNG